MNKDLKLVNSFDFNDIDHLYNYIFDSYINGNKKQSKEFFNHLWDKKAFLEFIKDQRIFKESYSYIYIQFLESLLID